MSNVDKFFKEKLKDREIPFDEHYWKQASEMLDAQDRRRRSKWWFFILTALLLIAGSWYIWRADNLVDRTKVTGTTAIDNLTKQEGNSAQQTEQSLQEQAIGQSGDELFGKSQKSTNNLTEEQPGLSFTNKPKTLRNDPSKYEAISKIEKPKAINESLKNWPSGKPHDSSTPTIDNIAEVATRATENANLIQSTTDPLTYTEQSGQTTDPAPKTEDASIESMQELFLLPSHYPILESPQYSIRQKVIAEKVKPVQWAVKAGPTLHNATSGASGLIGAAVGVQWNFAIRPHWRLGAELLYEYRDGHFMTTNQSRTTVYSFGKTIQLNQLIPDNLHYVSLPVYMQYRWNAYALEAGLAPAFLTGIRGRVYVNEQSGKQSWIEPHEFRKFHLQLMAGSRFHLAGGWDIGLRVRYAIGSILTSPDLSEIERALRESDKLNLQILFTKSIGK